MQSFWISSFKILYSTQFIFVNTFLLVYRVHTEEQLQGALSALPLHVDGGPHLLNPLLLCRSWNYPDP